MAVGSVLLQLGLLLLAIASVAVSSRNCTFEVSSGQLGRASKMRITRMLTFDECLASLAKSNRATFANYVVMKGRFRNICMVANTVPTKFIKKDSNYFTGT